MELDTLSIYAWHCLKCTFASLILSMTACTASSIFSLGPKLDGRNEFRFVLAVKAQLSPAYRLHVIDVDGASGSHDGLIARASTAAL